MEQNLSTGAYIGNWNNLRLQYRQEKVWKVKKTEQNQNGTIKIRTFNPHILGKF